MATEAKGTRGMAVDRFGGPTVDPTENVKSLMEASIKSLSAEAMLRERLSEEKIRRLEQGIHAAQDTAILRAEHNRELRNMESDRIDKIRSVDVANAAATAAQLLSAVNNLATTAAATAETLRNQVAATAQAAINSQSALINPIVERVAVLEKSSYTGAGKAGVADPQMEKLATLVEALAHNQMTSYGKHEGSGDTIKWIALVISMIVGLLAIGTFVFVTQRKDTPAAAVAPQVIYVPAPAAGSGAPLPGTAVPR